MNANINNTDEGKWITGKEAAEELYFSKQTIRRYSDQGYIRSIRTDGNQRRYLRADITDFSKEVKPELKEELNFAEKMRLKEFALQQMSIGLVISNACIVLAVLSIPLISLVSPAMFVTTGFLAMIAMMLRMSVHDVSTSIKEREENEKF